MDAPHDAQGWATEWGFSPDAVRHDHVLTWVLRAIAQHPTLAATWVFAGGSCIRKCFFETYRLASTASFLVLPGGPAAGKKLQSVLFEALSGIDDAPGLGLGHATIMLNRRTTTRPGGASIALAERKGSPPVAVTLKLHASELPSRLPARRAIADPYPGAPAEPAMLPALSLEEIFADKFAAIIRKPRAADLYDLVHLYRRGGLRRSPESTRSTVRQKLARLGLDLPPHRDLVTAGFFAALDLEWEPVLSAQMPVVPPLTEFWTELPNIFSFITDDSAGPPDLPLAESSDREPTDGSWRAPATLAMWNVGVPVELLRFSAANRLAVEIDYAGSRRLVEPYALRRSSAGHLLLLANKPDSNDVRSFRVDRIEGVRPTTRVFKPSFRVELAEAATFAPAASAGAGDDGGAVAGRIGSRARGAPGPDVYILECPYCGKRFERYTSDATLDPHLTPDGKPCRGARRTGQVLEVRQT